MGTHRRGTLAGLALTGALTAVLSGCGASSVPADEVASTIVTQLEQQRVTVDNRTVSCPAGVDVEVGQSVRCGFTAGGQPADAVATVSSVDGNDVNFQITVEARPVPRALLARTVTDLFVRSGIPAENVDCAGDLQPQVDQIQTCTVTSGGEGRPLTAKVTDVRGGLVNFSIQQVPPS